MAKVAKKVTKKVVKKDAIKKAPSKTTESSLSSKDSKKVVKRGKPVINLTLSQAAILQTTLAKKGRRQRFLDRKIEQAQADAATK